MVKTVLNGTAADPRPDCQSEYARRRRQFFHSVVFGVLRHVFLVSEVGAKDDEPANLLAQQILNGALRSRGIEYDPGRAARDAPRDLPHPRLPDSPTIDPAEGVRVDRPLGAGKVFHHEQVRLGHQIAHQALVDRPTR